MIRDTLGSYRNVIHLGGFSPAHSFPLLLSDLIFPLCPSGTALMEGSGMEVGGGRLGWNCLQMGTDVEVGYAVLGFRESALSVNVSEDKSCLHPSIS